MKVRESSAKMVLSFYGIMVCTLIFANNVLEICVYGIFFVTLHAKYCEEF